MIHKPRSLIDELYLVEGKAEIVHGEIVRMSPAGIGIAAPDLFLMLREAPVNRAVWDVDPLSDDVIKCFRSTDPERPQCFGRDDKADAEPAVPGWRFPVRRLFPS